jgi:hypothetical protein
MIQDVSDQLFGKFTEAMRRELEAPAPATPAAAPETSEGLSPQSPTPPPAPAPAAESVLDVGALGAAAAGRAAKRTLARPGFWIAAIVIAFLIYWFFFR